jgi:hypothetical protein
MNETPKKWSYPCNRPSRDSEDGWGLDCWLDLLHTLTQLMSILVYHTSLYTQQDAEPTYEYTLQITVIYRLVFTLFSTVLGSGLQRHTLPFLRVSEWSPAWGNISSHHQLTTEPQRSSSSLTQQPTPSLIDSVTHSLVLLITSRHGPHRNHSSSLAVR